MKPYLITHIRFSYRSVALYISRPNEHVGPTFVVYMSCKHTIWDIKVIVTYKQVHEPCYHYIQKYFTCNSTFFNCYNNVKHLRCYRCWWIAYIPKLSIEQLIIVLHKAIPTYLDFPWWVTLSSLVSALQWTSIQKDIL